MIEITVDPAQIQDIRDRMAYLANGANRAISTALNKTASKAKTVASRAIRSKVNLSAADVREKLKGPADGWEYKATINRLQAKIGTPKRGVLLRQFVTNYETARKGRPATPIRLKVAANATAIDLISGFYVKTKTSNVLAPAVRNEILRKFGMTRTLDSGPITVLHGPSLSQVFDSVRGDIQFDMSELLAKNLQSQMDWLLQKYPPPPGDGTEDAE